MYPLLPLLEGSFIFSVYKHKLIVDTLLVLLYLGGGSVQARIQSLFFELMTAKESKDLTGNSNLFHQRDIIR